MSDIKLGTPPAESAQRDAIHVAIIPMEAGETLNPGARVALKGGKAYEASEPTIGIVDPFLREAVTRGEKFWLMLHQHTVTNLRHAWSHPALSDEPTEGGGGYSNQWLENYARMHDLTYEQLMNGVKEYLDNHQKMDDDFKEFETPDEFWVHYKNITGRDGSGEFWGCCV